MSQAALDDYQRFLQQKTTLAAASGFECSLDEMSPILLPHQKAVVQWAVRRGRAALFESFGLGKTVQQLEILRLVLAKLGGGRGLIVCPLGVRQEFTRDAKLLGLEVRFIRTNAEAPADGIYITNYESVRDGKLDPRGFDVVSLDEAAILRGFGGTKTFRELMRLYEGTANYRFVATATPDPNEYIELLAYAAFLDVMDVGHAKTRWFKRDSTKADRLTLLPHMERDFWLWVASWALFLQKPSDIGYSDEGYELPPLEVRWHEIPAAEASPERGYDLDRQGRGHLFRDAGMGITQAAREKRESLKSRIAKMAELVAESPGDHFLLWHNLEAERHAIAAALPQAVAVWGSQDLEERERRIIDFSDGRIQYLAAKPVLAGAGCNFQRHCHRAIFVGIDHKFADLIQAIHRVQRFLQTRPVRIDLIYTEAERAIHADLERKWRQHDAQVARMGEIIRAYGLSHEALTGGLRRTVGVQRQEASGDGWLLVNNDAVEETATMAADSVDLVVSSIPFGTQYEYCERQRLRPHTGQRPLLATDGLPHPRAAQGAQARPCDRHPRQGSGGAGRADRPGLPDRAAVPRRGHPALHAPRVRVHGHGDGGHRRGPGEQPDLPAGLDRAVQGRLQDGLRHARVPAHLPQAAF
jgi:hypothetical protein